MNIETKLTGGESISCSHNTKKGVWGRLVLLEGCLEYRILEPQPITYVANAGDSVVIEPQRYHEVKPRGSHVRLFIEFHKRA